MDNIDRIKQEIESLPENDFIQLRKWFSEKDWKEWDRQIEEDSISGKLDFLLKEALEEKKLDSTILKTFLDGIEYRTVIHVIIPKLQNFGLIRIDGQRGKGKSYAITLDKKFSDRLRYLERGWFRIYAKYGDLNGG